MEATPTDTAGHEAIRPPLARGVAGQAEGVLVTPPLLPWQLVSLHALHHARLARRAHALARRAHQVAVLGLGQLPTWVRCEE